MASAQGDPYSPLVEKLQLPHPLVQRFAVNAIFEKLKSGPAHTKWESSVGQEAVLRCLTSSNAAVIDQTVKEMCNACAEGSVSVERGLQDLQAALDAVNSESVASVVNGIGFLSRLFLLKVKVGACFMGKSGDLLGIGFHPLVKSFQSRPEGHQHILRQVGVFLGQASPKQRTITLQFLQPFITFILLRPPSSPSHLLFARDLHSQLSLLSCQPHCELLLEMLISYVPLYQIETAEGYEFAIASIRELVDVWESQSTRREMQHVQVKDLEELGSQLLHTLVGLCHELLSCQLSLYHALVLVKRMMKSLRLLNPAFSDSVGLHMVSIAHMLAMVDLEQEQLLLLDLGVSWLEDIHGRGKQPGGGAKTAAIGPLPLVWVFPALHVMSYPSVAVKRAAMRLLEVLERALVASKDEVNFGKQTFVDMQMRSWGQQHLFIAEGRLLRSISAEEENDANWVSIMKADNGRKGTSGENWLKSLTAYLNKYSQHPRMVNPTSQSLGISKGSLVSLCTLVIVCLLNRNTRIALPAAEALASVAKVEPIWGMSILPVVLFCVRFRERFHGLEASEVQLGLLKVFPALAGHSATLPLVLQALQPMLDSKSDSAVQATGIRLLCRTWELTDRAFPHLQKMLRPGDIQEAVLQIELARSRAACVRDVSRKDPDRGVDLVLSVQACIERRDPVVVSLGLQSLALLCKEDLIDFYTAWLVISKLFPVRPSEPIVMQSLCMLLRYGALDAAAHPEAAAGVLEILWKAVTTKGTKEGVDVFSGARAMAFEGLSFYEVDDLEALCPDEKRNEVDLLRSETSVVVLPFLEDLLVKALAHEHRVRQRGQKEAKVLVSKLGKLLKAFPGALSATGFSPLSGKMVTSISDFPGAALLCFSLPAPEKTERVSKIEHQRSVRMWQSNHEKAFLEVSDQLHFGRNLVVAMLALQSWCSFMSRWLDAIFTTYEADSPNIGRNENLLRAAKYLSKITKKSCEDGIPRVAESATLALAALCKVMPTQAHGIAQDVSVFLEQRLVQEGHEHMQWSATLALGVVSTCLHDTDWSRKHGIVQLLLKHAGSSDRGIVRGACGLALGIISQSLLRPESSVQSAGLGRKREIELLVQIILSLVQLTSEASPTAAPALGKFLGLLRTEVVGNERLATYPLPQHGPKLEEENFWAVVGLVWGLGSSVTGLSQLHCATLVSTLTDLMISWVSGCSNGHNDSTDGNRKWEDVSDFFLAAGACLALSTCAEVSARLEVLTEGVDVLLQNAMSLIVNATDPGNTTGMEQWKSSLLCSLYVGSGNLLATVLQDGAQSISLELVQKLLGYMQAGVERSDHKGWGQLGAMIGIANSFGAGAGLLMPSNLGPKLAELNILARVQVGGTEQSTLSRPLLHEATCEEYVSAIIRGILGVVRSEQDVHLKSYAGWALAFMHKGYFGDGQGERKEEELFSNVVPSSQPQAKVPSRQSGYYMRSLQDFPEDSPLRQLCTMLMSHEQMEMVASVLRCLEKAPRLPALDWGGIVRREMRQNQPSLKGLAELHQVGTSIVRESKFSPGQKEVRQQCVLFAFAHAEQVPALASFLDELCELSRLGTLEASLRNLLMLHIFHLQRIFSPLRLRQLFQDVQEYAVNPTGLAGFLLEDKMEVESQRSSFRVSLWNGLALFFEEFNSGPGEESDDVISLVEECMMVLIRLLSPSIWGDGVSQAKEADESHQVLEEWSAAISALARTPKTWLMQAFEVQVGEGPETQEETDSCARAVFARGQLVGTGCLSIAALKICGRWLLRHRSSDVRRLLVEVAWAMKGAPLEERREWLLDCLDTAFISPFPTTAIILAALLTSCWSTMSLLLPLNPTCAVEDLPLTLPSVLSQEGGKNVKKIKNPVTWAEERLQQLHGLIFDENIRAARLQAFHTRSEKQKAFDRTFQYWSRTARIYASYKPTQLRVQFVKDEVERDRIWEQQHARAADRVYALCCDLKPGFFLKKLPQELFFIIRTAQLLRGLSVGMDLPFSSSQQWRPLAEAALAAARKPSTFDGTEETKIRQPRELRMWNPCRRCPHCRTVTLQI